MFVVMAGLDAAEREDATEFLPHCVGALSSLELIARPVGPGTVHAAVVVEELRLPLVHHPRLGRKKVIRLIPKETVSCRIRLIHPVLVAVKIQAIVIFTALS